MSTSVAPVETAQGLTAVPSTKRAHLNRSALVATCMDLPRLVARGVIKIDSWLREEVELSGFEGLARAARFYDEGQGVTFRQWATICVQGAELDCLRRLGWVPKRVWARLSEDERSAAAHVPLDMSLLDELVTLETAEEDLVAAERSSAVLLALAGLPRSEAAVLFGLYFQDLTLDELGELYGFSRSWGCRLHSKALVTLRKRMARGLS